MFLNKDLNLSQLKTSLREVKDNMLYTSKRVDDLDKKTHELIKISISILLGLVAANFILSSRQEVLIPSIILLIGTSLSLWVLCLAYKCIGYHSNGNIMKDIEQEDDYYHDEQGLMIYLIKIYQKKIEYNENLNAKRSSLINRSIAIMSLSSLLSFCAFCYFSIRTLYQ